MSFILGTCSVRSSVLKDGHVFTVHVLDPKEASSEEEEEERSTTGQKTEDGTEKADTEKSEKEGQYS